MEKLRTWLHQIPFSVIILLSLLTGMLYFQGLYKFDNKYTWPNFSCSMGIGSINMDTYSPSTIYYLVDEWEYYDNKILTPAQIKNHTPDEYLFIGKYSGFDQGNPDKSPYGCATYRLTIFTDSLLREYALEIPTIYSTWNLYINGNSAADNNTSAGNGMITFQAQNSIEIIVTVADDSHLYSGLTYPLAFGSPQAVGKIHIQRLLIHCASVTVSLLLAFLCLPIGFGNRNAKSFKAFVLLCIFIAGSTSYPLLYALKLTSSKWLMFERLCYYSSFLILILLQGNILKLSPKTIVPALTFSVIILLSVIMEPIIPFDRAVIKYLYGDLLGFYKWFIAIWLVGTNISALRKKIQESRILIITALLFACALFADRFYPLFEPVRFGWPVETVGLLFLLAIGTILCQNTMIIYQKEVIMEAELNIAAEKEKSLIETNIQKSKFLSNISHELKLPLTVISGYAQLSNAELSDNDINIQELQDHMNRIIREADRMERMVSQLLDITRIETDRFSLDIEPISIEELIQQIVDIQFPILNDQNNILKLNIPQNMPPILGDSNRISQVLINLLSNACRHTMHGTITIQVEPRTKELLICISDTGEGIPADLLPGLFERYLTNTAGQYGQAKGTGLGLYICKIIVEAHHGSISVTSHSGLGTTFYFTLPLAQKVFVMEENQ